MNFAWLLLIPALALITWIWPRLALWRPLRALALLALIALLVDPKWDRTRQGMELWLLVDQSASTAAQSQESLAEWKEILKKAKPGRHDRLRVVHYANEVMEEQVGDGTSFPNRSLSQGALAIRYALANATPDQPKRLLMMSDGYHTEPLEEAATQLGRSGIPLDYRLIGASMASDARVIRIDTPTQVTTGTPFLLRVEFEAPAGASMPVEILRNGRPIYQGQLNFKKDRESLQFTDRIPRAGAYEYRVILQAENDPVAGNNQLTHWLEVQGGPRILLISSYPDDPLLETLQNQEGVNYQVELVTAPSRLQASDLTGVKSVILNNVAAFDLPLPFIEALPFFVEAQGGGLIMAGGSRAFGSGGYFESPVDPLLPVSMELKEDVMKLQVALAIVLDRSGSMGMSVAGGQTKMELAASGTARAIELLGLRDEISVLAVDSAPHTVIPLERIGNEKRQKKFIKQALGIQSGGGGIYVYEGLDAAWKELRKSKAGTRHLILFSDASDSEHPDQYQKLLEKMVRGGATVTVIGLGSPTDSDAALLEDIAKRGKGRIIFTNKAATLPQLFAQEAIAVARSAFLTDPTPTVATGLWGEISSELALEFLPSVEAYNLSYLRPGASAPLLTQDEYQAPLVAHIRRGLGRVAAISFPMAGEHSAATRNWPAYGDFAQSLVNWTLGDPLPAGIGLSHRLQGTQLDIDLLYTKEHEARLTSAPPELVLMSQRDGATVQNLVWSRMSPGHYRCSVQLQAGEVYRGALQLFDQAIPFGPVSAGTETEWLLERARIEDLRAASQRSGGRELLDLSEAWLRPEFTAELSLSPYLGALALIALLLDALITRTGWRLPTWSKWSPLRRSKNATSGSKPGPSPGPAAASQSPSSDAPGKPEGGAEDKTTPPEPAQSPAASRKSRFNRAKRR